MKKLALITVAAVLGTTSLAFADRGNGDGNPDYRDDGDHRYDGDRRYDDGDRFDNDDAQLDENRAYYDDDADNRQFQADTDGNYWRGGHRFIRAEQKPRWVGLGTAGSGMTRIKVGAELGRFQTLRLDVSGWMRVQRVVVKFANGETQTVRMRSFAGGMRAGNRAPLVIDLSGGSRRIVGISVFAGQYGRGTVSVSGLETPRHFWRRYMR